MNYFYPEIITCYIKKCCGCCKNFIKEKEIIPDCRAPGMGGNEVSVGECKISGFNVMNRNEPCKQWEQKYRTQVINWR